MKITKTQLKQIIKEELGTFTDAGPTGKVHTVKLLLGGEYDDRITIKNAEEVTSPNPETLIIDHIEIDLQFGLKVLNITEGL
jgi:hypothetical protein